MRILIHKWGTAFAALMIFTILQGLSQRASAAVTLTPSTLPAWTLGKAFSQTLAGSGGASPYTFAVTTGTLPAGLSIAPTTGVISGTPTAAGSSTFIVTATDHSSVTGTQSYTLVINPAITLTPTTLAGWTINRPYSQTITSANGTGTRTFSISGSLPTGIAFTAATGVLAGTPTAAGSSTFTITATDSVGATTPQAYTLVINPAVTLIPTTLPNWTLGKAYSQTIAGANGTGTKTLALTGTTPTGMAFAPTTGILNGTPTTAATYNFSVTATDTTGATGTQAYTIIISPAVTISPASVPAWTVNQGNYSQTITSANGTGTRTLSLTAGTLPAGMAFNTTTGVINGTPTATGTAGFTITATDSVGATVATAYSLTVNAAVTVSPATLPNWTVSKSGYTQTVTSANGTGARTLSISGSAPTGMTFATATGVLSGTPTAAGTFNFTVTATDTSGATGSQAYAVVINPAVTVTPATLPAWTINQAGYTQTVSSANGTGSKTLSLSAGAVPTGMTFATATGVLSGTPTVAGTFNFTITATDFVGATGAVAYSVVINPALAIATTTLPNWTLNRSYSQTLSTTGGTGADTFAVTSGALPGGLTLTTGGLLGGTTSAAGTFTFTITATDSAGAPSSQAYTVTINPAVTITTSTLAAWTSNNPGYSQTISTTGGTGTNSFSIVSGSLPSGLTLSSTGVLSGTPTIAGTYNFSVAATDTVGATGTQTLTLLINPALVITPTSLPDWTAGKNGYNQTISATGGTDSTFFNVTSGTVPGGLILSSTGLLSGKPTATGTFSFTVTTADSVGATASQAYTVVINPAVTITPTTLPNWTANQTGYSQTITSANGTGARALALASGAIPTGMTFDLGTGLLNGMPTATGTFNFTITATDVVGATASQAYTLVINAALTVTPATLPDWTVNKAYSKTIAVTGGAGSPTFAISSGALPGGLTLSNGGALAGTPNVAGAFTFAVTATDTVGATGTRNYTVVINPAVTLTPSVLPNWTVSKNGYSQSIVTSGGTGAVGLVSSGTLPNGLTFANNVVSGTPTATGTFNFTLTATDSVGAITAVPYTIVISPVVAIATTSLSGWTVNQGGYSQPIIANNGTGAKAFAVTTGVLPSGLALSTTGLLSGTPSATGTYPFSVTATDAVGANAKKSYTVIINAAVVVTKTTLPNWTNHAAFNQVISTTGGTGATAFTVTAGTLPTGLALTGAGVLSGIPSATGTFAFTITGTDSVGATSGQPYSVVISPAVTITPSSLPNWTANVSGYSQTITSANGTGARTLEATAGAIPPGLSFNAATGMLSGTPTDTGEYDFTIVATDSVGALATQNYAIIVNAGVTFITTSLPDSVVGTPGYNQTISTLNGTGAATTTVTAGTFPPGLTLASAGIVSGTPTAIGVYTFTVTATDAVGGSNTQSFTVIISPAPPTVISPTVTAVTGTSATLGGNVSSDGGATISARGVVLSLSSSNSNPQIGGTGVIKLTGTGTTGVFTVLGSPLTAATDYTFAAYATNNQGTVYSPVGTFKTLSNDATLAGLTLTPVTLSPAFSSTARNYTASVPNLTSSLAITPTLAQANATVKINGNSAVSGSPTSPFPLSPGANTLTVVVTAQDGTTTSTYTVVVTRATPFISVQQPVGNNLPNGAATTDFGGALVGKTVVRMFTVKNIGSGLLQNLLLPITGDNASDFVVTTPPAASLAAGASTTFAITFTPSDVGARSAAIHIDATGETLNPFVIALAGTGTVQPVFNSPPASQIIAVGQTPAPVFNADASGGALTYQWLKGTTVIAGATNQTYSPAATLASGGTYAVKATNAAGPATSDAANLGVVLVSDSTTTVVTGKTLTLTASAAGPATLSYQWRKDGQPLDNGRYDAVTHPGTISGAKLATLTITKVMGDDAGVYTCVVSVPNPQHPETPLTLSTGNFTVNVTRKPTLDSFSASWMVSKPVTDSVSAHHAPTSFTLSGQPAGVTLDNQGHFHGKPTVAITHPTDYTLTITATNAAGTSDAIHPVITVQTLPVNTVGAFQGSIDPNLTLNAGMGSRFELTTTSSGTFTGKIITGTTTVSIAGPVAVDPLNAGGLILNATVPNGASAFALILKVADDTAKNGLPAVTGSLSGQADSVPVNAWRNTWNATDHKATFFKGLHTLSLEQPDTSVLLPQGFGYASFTVAETTGALTVSGKLADGSTVTTITFAGPHGEVLIYQPLYANTGSVIGKLVIDKQASAVDNLISGTAAWFKPAQAPASKDLLYHAGFNVSLTADGASYIAPGAKEVVMGLNNTINHNAELDFNDGGLVSGAEPDIVFSIRNVSATSGLADKITVPPATRTSSVTMTVLTPASGAFSGSFTLYGATKALNRTVAYQGLIVKHSHPSPVGTTIGGYGYFILPQVPATSQLSGQVLLGAYVPLTTL